MPNDVGAIVKRYREREGWTQKELAEKIDKTDSYISLMEAGGVKSPGLDTIEALAIVFRESPLVFFSPVALKINLPITDPKFGDYLNMAIRAYRCGMPPNALEALVEVYTNL